MDSLQTQTASAESRTGGALDDGGRPQNWLRLCGSVSTSDFCR